MSYDAVRISPPYSSRIIRAALRSQGLHTFGVGVARLYQSSSCPLPVLLELQHLLERSVQFRLSPRSTTVKHATFYGLAPVVEDARHVCQGVVLSGCKSTLRYVARFEADPYIYSLSSKIPL